MPNLGTIMLIMGINMFDEKLSSFLFNKTRRGLLALLYGRTEETFYINQLMQATGSGSGAVMRELRLMTEAGVLTRKETGNLVYYQANPQCPIFNELKSLVTRTVSTPSWRFPISEYRLAEFCRNHHIKKLSLFGSVLREDFHPDSDIDVLVEFEPGHVPGFGMVDMENELSRMVGRKVDLRTPKDLSRYFRDRVVKEASLEYEKTQS